MSTATVTTSKIAYSEAYRQAIDGLKKLMKEYGISQAQISRASDISEITVMKVFKFQSKNQDVIDTAFKLIDEAKEKEAAMLDRINTANFERQQAAANREYFTQHSKEYNFDNQQISEAL